MHAPCIRAAELADFLDLNSQKYTWLWTKRKFQNSKKRFKSLHPTLDTRQYTVHLYRDYSIYMVQQEYALVYSFWAEFVTFFTFVTTDLSNTLSFKDCFRSIAWSTMEPFFIEANRSHVLFGLPTLCASEALVPLFRVLRIVWWWAPVRASSPSGLTRSIKAAF